MKRFPFESSSEATAKFTLRIHGHLGLEEPLNHKIVAVRGCQMQRCFASRAEPPAEPKGTKRRNSWENFDTSEVKVLGIVDTQTSP